MSKLDHHDLTHGQAALEATRMVEPKKAIATADEALGTLSIMRAGSGIDGTAIVDGVRKPASVKTKIAEVGPTKFGIPRHAVHGRRKADGTLYDHLGAPKGYCYTQNAVPLSDVLNDCVKGIYKLVNPETGETINIKDQTKLKSYLASVRQSQKLYVQLDQVPEGYDPVKKVGEVYCWDLAKSKQAVRPNEVAKHASQTCQDLFKEAFADQFTHRIPVSAADNLEAAKQNKFVPVEVLAKEFKLEDGTTEIVPVISDEDGLGKANNLASANGKRILSLIPDADEVLHTFDKESGEFARKILMEEILSLKGYIEQLQKDEKPHTQLIAAFQTIRNIFITDDNKLRESTEALIYSIGSATKRDFFWKLYYNALRHGTAKQDFYTDQHGDESKNPGKPSDMDKNVIPSDLKGEAVLAKSQEGLVAFLSSDENRGVSLAIHPQWIRLNSIWATYVAHELKQEVNPDIQVSVEFFNYLQELQQQLTKITPLLGLHSHTFPNLQDLKKAHPILVECKCAKSAHDHITSEKALVIKAILNKFALDTARIKQMLGQKREGADVHLIAVKLKGFYEKIIQLNSLLNNKEFAAAFKNASFNLTEINKLLKFEQSSSSLYAVLDDAYDLKAVEYVKQIAIGLTAQIQLLQVSKKDEEGEKEGEGEGVGKKKKEDSDSETESPANNVTHLRAI